MPGYRNQPVTGIAALFIPERFNGVGQCGFHSKPGNRYHGNQQR